MSTARQLKNMIEGMFKQGVKKLDIVNKVVATGIEYEVANFLVNLYCRK